MTTLNYVTIGICLVILVTSLFTGTTRINARKEINANIEKLCKLLETSAFSNFNLLYVIAIGEAQQRNIDFNNVQIKSRLIDSIVKQVKTEFRQDLLALIKDKPMKKYGSKIINNKLDQIDGIVNQWGITYKDSSDFESDAIRQLKVKYNHWSIAKN